MIVFLQLVATIKAGLSTFQFVPMIHIKKTTIHQHVGYITKPFVACVLSSPVVLFLVCFVGVYVTVSAVGPLGSSQSRPGRSGCHAGCQND